VVLGIAVSVFALATLGLALLVEPVPSWYYHLAWWSYIVAVDDLNRRGGGRSLLRDRRRRLLRLAGVSVAWWTLFEVLNLRLGNWYYVMDDPRRAVRWLGGAVAFATVLPGIAVTLACVERRGWLRAVAVPPLAWSAGRDRACAVLGALSLALLLWQPRYFFPLAWAWTVLLIEPWNRRHARRSYLRDLVRGEAGPLCQALLAGLICGLLWETWNYWARTKWIYTVPFLERLKLFEMPLLGFLGFPPFAVACLGLIRFLQAVGERWRPRGPLEAVAWAGLSAATALAFVATEGATVDSYYVPVRALRVIEPRVRQRLADLGLGSPEKVQRALGSEAGLETWSRRSGLGRRELEQARAAAELVTHRGLGEGRARELGAIGVASVADLRRWRADELARQLRARGAASPFLERRARVWVAP
jgi:hypothetical protein